MSILVPNTPDGGEYVAYLFETQVNAHIAHLQTKSFAAHSALDGLYKSLPGLIDAFTEAYQGVYGIITKYDDVKIYNGVNMVAYLTKQVENCRHFRKDIKEGELQQLIDNVIEEIDSVIYKLKNLS